MVSVFVGLIVAAVIGLVILAVLERLKNVYVTVPAGQAHYVATPRKSYVASPDAEVAPDGKRGYYVFPSNIPRIGCSVRVMNIKMQEINDEHTTIEKNQAQYNVSSSAKYRIIDATKAAQTCPEEEELKTQLKEVIKAAVRTVTAKYTVEEVRNKKSLVSGEIETEIKDDFAKWGLVLESFQLVEFTDAPGTTVITDISKKREEQIKADTKISVAQKDREAREAIAEADKEARQKEILAQQEVKKQEELSQQEIEKEKAKTVAEQMAVKKEEQIRSAEIEKERNIIRQQEEKEKKIIKAEEEKEVAALNKESRELSAAAARKEKEENAIGDAAKIRADKEAEAEGIRAVADAEATRIKSKLLAEAEGKEKLAAALSKYGDEEIRAMVAERIVDANEAVGLETAKALAAADLKMIVGGSNEAANLGKAIETLQTTSPTAAGSILNFLARPNDLGFSPVKDDESESGWKTKPAKDKTEE